jgi:beta-glucosidase
VLPLPADGSIAVIGPFATEPRFQGGGSSRVVPTRVDIPFDEIAALAPDAELVAVEGYRLGGGSPQKLRDDAIAAARAADTAVVFIGLTAADEAEGTDRTDIDLPEEQLSLLDAVSAVNPRTVAVVVHGGVVRLGEVARSVPAVVDGSILGQAGGGALADVLFGVVNPSGRLTETVPLRLGDSPAFLNYPGDQLHIRYGEGIFVGYRGYDELGRDVVFPFGHGLSYTRFEYRDLRVSPEPDGIRVELDVANVGSRDGREVVQLYVGKKTGVVRPPRELKGFANVQIRAGGVETVSVVIPRSDLAYWDVRLHRWVVEGGEYRIDAAASSRDIRLSDLIEVEADDARRPFTDESTIGELLEDPAAAAVIGTMMRRRSGEGEGVASEELGIDANKSAMRIPIGRVRSLSGGQGMTRTELAGFLDELNEQR